MQDRSTLLDTPTKRAPRFAHASAAQRLARVQLSPEAVLLAPETVQLHLPVQGSRVNQRVLGRQVDPAPVLPQDPGQVVLLGAPEVLLQRDLVVVAGLSSVAVAALATDARMARQIDLADHGAAGTQDGALDDVPQLTDVARPGVAHELG